MLQMNADASMRQLLDSLAPWRCPVSVILPNLVEIGDFSVTFQQSNRLNAHGKEDLKMRVEGV
jgi:hypothetical protein